MRIDELNTRRNLQNMTVTLEYSEIRDIANALFELQRIEGQNTAKHKEIYAKMQFLFDMIKHGNVMSYTVKRLFEISELQEAKNGK